MIGIGADIIDIRRIEKTINRFGNKFKKRIFTKEEINKCEGRKLSINCYAKRYAAKEAASKALGSGFRKGVFWRDLEVSNLPSGQPTIIFHGGAKKQLESISLVNNKPNINLTITDEYPYAQAIVIIEGS
ncbi:holo-ACP synthase [Pelagibacteraceae bacterium]|nr:holo-ACP synthase [Pelagibacteraceae bacterium]